MVKEILPCRTQSPQHTLNYRGISNKSSGPLCNTTGKRHMKKCSASQASMSITSSQGLLKLMPIELVMPSNHLILCHPFLLPPSIFPNIRVFSNESALHTRWPKYWRFSFNISPSSEHPGLSSFLMDWLDLLAVQ